MGKGDRRTFRGKVSIRSYGNARPHRVKPKHTERAAAKVKARKKS
jgi:ribosomal small subunit protein bTHX